MRNYNISVKTAFAVLAVALSACSSDNDITENNPVNPETPVSNSEQMTFSVSMDAGNETRTVFNGNNTIWEAGDQIRVMNRATITASGQSNYEWHGYFDIVKQSGTFTKEEVFKGTRIKSNGDGTDCFYAFYPSSSKLGYYNNDNGAMNSELPAQQTAIAGSFDKSLHLMTAFSNNTTFAFKNVCALLRITLENSNIRRVKVVANPDASFNYTYISGAFSALVNKADGTTTDGKGNSTVTENTNNKNRLTYVELNVETGATKIADGTYYLVVLPASLPQGFTLLFETEDGNTIYQRVNTKTPEFKRNQVYDLGTYDFSDLPSDIVALADVVDLGLPSGTLWATKNIAGYKNGVDSMFTATVYDHGQFYAWGEDFGYKEGSNQSHASNESSTLGTYNWTSTPATGKSTAWPQTNKDNYAWVTYKWCSGGYSNLSPGSDDIIKYVDADLKEEDDIAYLKSGGRYCMPTKAQLNELLTNCTYPSSARKESGKAGARFTSKVENYTTKSIWLPAAGCVYNNLTYTSNWNSGKMIQYWTRSYCREKNTYLHAYCLDRLSSSSSDNVDYDRRFSARTIRAVATNACIAKLNK